VAARSVPRIVAGHDSGIDANPADLALNVVQLVSLHEPANSQGSFLNSRCATSGRCYPHGTEMAGTIGGRMNNGIGVVGVAPHSRLVPIVISQVDRGLLARSRPGRPQGRQHEDRDAQRLHHSTRQTHSLMLLA
jgi:hypothetical protein